MIKIIDPNNCAREPLSFMFITNVPRIAAVAEDAGVERIWVDLEILGKELRQPGMNTVKSGHTLGDISTIRSVLKKAELLVRVNSIYSDSEFEINQAIDRGADILMLPYFKTPDEVERFLNIVKGRVRTTLLFETKESVDNIDKIISLGGFDEAHIGLNDLHLSYGLTFMFELLSNGVVELLCTKFDQANIPYGFGGIAKICEGLLPAERIIAEHYRLGSSRVILSRSFCDAQFNNDFKIWEREFRLGVNQIRMYESLLPSLPISYFQNNIQQVANDVATVVNLIKTKKNANK